MKRIPERPRLGVRLREFGDREERRILVGDYEIRYEVAERDVFVLRIFHTREDRRRPSGKRINPAAKSERLAGAPQFRA